MFRLPIERQQYLCSAPGSVAQPCSVSGLWQVESLSRYAYNSRGQVTARCEVDPLNATAMAYACNSAAPAPTGVRKSTTTYCDAIGSNCPLIGLVTQTDGPRTNVADTTTLAYYAADASTCASTRRLSSTRPYMSAGLSLTR